MVPGYYSLTEVNGQPLPYISPPSLGLGFVQIWRGDLVLRPNGTFAHGLGAGLGGLVEGRYRIAGSELVFETDAFVPKNGTVAQVSDGTITFTHTQADDRNLTFTFRRASLPSPLASNRYRLSSINGRTEAPLVAYDTVMGDTRYLSRIPFDSITISDGVFFRRHRLQIDSSYTVDIGPIGANVEEWTVWGAYETAPGGKVVLHHYSKPSAWVRLQDTLSIAGDTLVRRTPLIIGPYEERYTP
jgi:hypothetical protein